MHPAFSVIVFTTTSGAGYGLLALLGTLNALGRLPQDPWFGGWALALALALVSIGLLSSTLHLGRPERAWRAFSQWRSSWLSREGVVAVLTYIPAGLLGVGWVLLERTDGPFALAGLAASAGAVVTVWCTGMIYRSLKPIHQWHNGWVLPNYLLLGLLSGALLLSVLLHLWGEPLRALDWLVVALIPVGVVIKMGYWIFIDRTRSPSTPLTATGLGPEGPVYLLDAPHTEENYLLKEMGFHVARKHATKLRRMALLAAFALPLLFMLLAMLTDGWVATLATMLAALHALLGVLVERWLFFAEARHTVTLYYGAFQV